MPFGARCIAEGLTSVKEEVEELAFYLDPVELDAVATIQGGKLPLSIVRL